jgi:hypothetical protein
MPPADPWACGGDEVTVTVTGGFDDDVADPAVVVAELVVVLELAVVPELVVVPGLEQPAMAITVTNVVTRLDDLFMALLRRDLRLRRGRAVAYPSAPFPRWE